MPTTLESALIEQANPRVSDELKKLRAIIEARHLWGDVDHGPNVTSDGRITVAFYDERPDGAFLEAVAQAFDVPVDSITFTVERKTAGPSEWDSHLLSFPYFPLSTGPSGVKE